MYRTIFLTPMIVALMKYSKLETSDVTVIVYTLTFINKGGDRKAVAIHTSRL